MISSANQSSTLPETFLKDSLVEEKIVYNSIASKSATFKSGTTKKIHNWFRLTPSFGPELVDIMLEKLKAKSDEVVLDPFSGASTTLIQCRLLKIKSCGFEINPLLCFVGKASLTWELDPKILKSAIKNLERQFQNKSDEFANLDLEETGFDLPKIYNIHRWWRKDVLKDLLIIKSIIRSLDVEVKYKDFLLLGLAGVLVPDLTNVTLGKLQLHFINRDEHNINALDTFLQHVNVMISDLEVIKEDSGIENTPSTLYHTDSTDIDHLDLREKVDIVITSPPYPNRYSYVWNTRPHLFFLDIFDNPKQASGLDLKTIGGTWGSATSVLQKGIIEPLYPIIALVVEPITEKIRVVDNLMANYVMKYFNLLAKQIVEMEKVAATNLRVAYVVGNSEIKGVYVETDVLLGKIFEGLNLGYSVTEITRFRKRNSGVDLYESIVYASK